MKKLLLLLLLPAMLLVSCSKKSDDAEPDITLDQTTVSLNYDKEYQFAVKKGASNIDLSSMKWTSSDETIGTVSATGLFKAKRIGTATVQAVGNGTTLNAQVTINPYSTLCREPFVDFGSSLAAIKAKETRVLATQSTTLLNYTGENSKLRNVLYSFDNTGMTSAALLFANTTQVTEETVKFFSERYQYEGMDSDVYFFTKNNVLIGLTYDDVLGLSAIYVKNTAGLSATSNLKTLSNVLKREKESSGISKLIR